MMRRYCAVLMFLAWNLVVAESVFTAPRLRRVNYVALHPGGSGKIGLECIQHGYRPYQDPLVVRRIFQGKAETAIRVPMGERGRFSVSASGERVALEIDTGWNLGVVSPAENLVYAYRAGVRQPLQTVGEWGPLYFFVPAETRYFNLWFGASVQGEGLRYEVRDAFGTIVQAAEGDFDKRTKVQTLLKPGQAGTAWSVRLLKPVSKDIYTDDVAFELGRHLPPFLTSKPEWAQLLAEGWRYNPEKVKSSGRIPSGPPTLSPWRGKKGVEMDEAYERIGGAEWRSSLPFTYILDYGSKHLGNPEYVPMVKTAPPTLLHLGKDVTFNHGWGPVHALGGENQAYGYGESIRRLTPGEVGQRLEGLRRMADELHAAGTRWVTPYICSMTLNGDPQRRSGFWEFYDHWDEYRQFGLGPRPDSDPLTWLQTKPDGTPAIYYGYKYPEEFYPRFKNNHRFAACWHTAGWRAWLLDVVRGVAHCGFDGVFVDNGTSQRSMSPSSLKAFRAFLEQRFPPEQAREVLGVEDLESVEFPGRKGGTIQLRSEQWRFWCETIRQQMAAIRQAGSEVLGRDFIVFPNGGRPHYIQEALRDCDFVMFEKSHGEKGTHPGTVVSPVFEGVTINSINDNIYEYRIVQSMRERVRPIILSRPGYPRSQPWLRLNADAARLGMAECGAFSGGGGFLLRPRFDTYHDALNEYRKFFETHPRLFCGMVPATELGILAGLEQHERGNATHGESLRSLTRLLSDKHALYEFVPERRQNPKQLSRYNVLVAANLPSISNERLSAVEDFVVAGGRLLVLGEFATADEYLQKRESNFVRLVAALPPKAALQLGEGKVKRVADLAGLVENVSQANVSCASPGLASGIRINAWKGKKEERLVLHLVNYNVPLGVAPPPAPKLGTVEVQLPVDFPVKTATLHIPGKEAQTIACKSSAGQIFCQIPEFPVYAVVEFE